MPKYVVISLLLLGLFSCVQERSPETSDTLMEDRNPISKAQQIVDQAIAAHGGSLYDEAAIQFVFRDRLYKRSREAGAYQFERIFLNPEDTSQMVRDILSNSGFSREINEQPVAVVDTMAAKYSNSVNSVLYFAMLPYRLNDPAVIKAYLGETHIQNNPYYKVQVTFHEEGGGKDFEDTFIYWFHRETYKMDYLAYNYETDGGGSRFRAAINPREVEGIRFQDYINYKMDKTLPLEMADSLFEAGELEELSRIILKAIEVESD